MIKTIILDFDGVVIESVDIKTRAFAAMFADQPEIAGPFLEYHLKNNGKSRFNKFAWLYDNILKKPLSTEKKEELGNKFSAMIRQQILACPYVAGVRAFLEEYHAAIPIYVASITPQPELIEIIKERSLNKYFKGVLGGTGKKTALINEILDREKTKPQEAVFVGDTKEDYLSAQETGVRFVALTGTWGFDEIDAPKFRDFFEISNFLKGLV